MKTPACAPRDSNPKPAESTWVSIGVRMRPRVGTVNGLTMHACPWPSIRVRWSVAPHLAPLRVSESTEVWADLPASGRRIVP